MFNARELITLLLTLPLVVLVIVLAVCLPRRSRVRLSLGTFALLAYVAGMIYVGHILGVWRRDFWGATVFWLVTAGFVAFYGLSEVGTDRTYFRRNAIATVSFTAITGALLGVFVFPWPIELVTQLLSLFFGWLLAAGVLGRVRRIGSLLIPLAMAVYSLFELESRWAGMDWGITARQFFLPIWLSLCLLPFLWALAVQSSYTAMFAAAEFANRPASLPLPVKAAFIARHTVRLRRIDAFRRSKAGEFGRTTTWADAMTVINDFNAGESQRRREQRKRRTDLRHHAGSDEVDDRGRRVDRREFARTRRVLSLLAMRQLGHCRNGGRYRPDLVTAHPADYLMDGGSAEPDLTLIVAEDGRSWYAWRRTVTGWCFAIGAARPPNDLWKYDGAEPPEGGPASSPGWTDDIREQLPEEANWHGLA